MTGIGMRPAWHLACIIYGVVTVSALGFNTSSVHSTTATVTSNSSSKVSSSPGLASHIATGLDHSSSAPNSASSASFSLQSSTTPPGNHSLGNGTSSIPLSGAASALDVTSSTTYTGDCLQQWSSYWVVSSNYYPEQLWSTYTTTETNTRYGISWLTYVTFLVETSYAEDGAFTQSTEVLTVEATEMSAVTLTQDMSLVTYTETIPTATFTESLTLQTPACSLPSIVPACESQLDSFYEHSLSVWFGTEPTCSNTQASSCSTSWSSWSSLMNIRGINSPLCTQASLAADLCSSLRRATQSNFIALPQYSLVETIVGNITSTTEVWPSTSMIAPGCSLGCGICAITGGTVQLIYWPQTALAIANSSNDGLVTATGYGTTFTSPTVYISYDSLYASDSCGGIGKTYNRTIIPVANTNDLSSVWGPVDWYYTASFNLTNLNPPVPWSIYSSQPRCVLPQRGCTDACESNHILCNTKLPYNPILSIPIDVRALDPAWAYCVGDLRGVYDPPSALTPATALATPTISFSSATSPASPAGPTLSQTVVSTSTPAKPGSPTTVARLSKTASGPHGVASSNPGLSTSTLTSSTASAFSVFPDSPESPSGVIPTSSDETLSLPSDQATLSASDFPTLLTSGLLVSASSESLSTSTQGMAASTTANIGDIIASVLGLGPVPVEQSAASRTTTQNPGALVVSVLPGAGSSYGGSAYSVATEAQPSIPAGPTDALQNTALTSSAPTSIAGPTSNPISVGLGGVIIGTSTALYSEVTLARSTASAAIFAIGSQTYTVQAGAVFTIGSAVNSQGGPAITIDQLTPTRVSQVEATITVGSEAYTASMVSSAIVLGSLTISQGGDAATISGKTFSAVASGIVIEDSTYALSPSIAAPSPSSAEAIVTIGSQQYTVSALASGIALDSMTLLDGGPATTMFGHTVSAANTRIVVDGSTLTLRSSGVDTSAPLNEVTITIVSHVYTVTAVGSGIAFASTTLSVGGPAITTSGQTISAGVSCLVVDGSAYALSAAGSGVAATRESIQTLTIAGPVTIAGTQYIAYVTPAASVYAEGASAAVVVSIDGQTLTVGGAAITIEGKTFSALPSALVVDGTPISFRSVTMTTTTALSGSMSGSADIPVSSSKGTEGSPVSTTGRPLATQSLFASSASASPFKSSAMATREVRGYLAQAVFVFLAVCMAKALA